METESKAPVVALVEDDADFRAATEQLLLLAGYATRLFCDAETALQAIDADFDGIVVTDIRMPGMSGIELFRALHARDKDLPIILMTGHGDIDMAVSAIRGGAWDFLEKPFAPDNLIAAIGRAMVARSLVMENRALRRQETGEMGGLVGRSPAIRHLKATIPTLAATTLDVVIEGATGTGKQTVARLLHRSGHSRRGPFVVLDCAVLPAAIADRELLAGNGPIARAHRGTLFLDNLDRADEGVQHRLATFAERRAVNLQARDPENVETRIVAAIDEERRGYILPALYHRIAAVTLRLPLLSERLEDVPILFAHFAGLAADHHQRAIPGLGDAAHLLGKTAWPGNVRELELAAERFVLGLDSERSPLTEVPLPDRIRSFERSAIVDALARVNGDVGKAVDLLRIPRETLYYRMKRLKIDIKSYRVK